MGVYSDVIAAAKTFTNEAGQPKTYQQLEAYKALQGDPAAPAAFAAVNAEQTIAFDVNIDGGDFTLTVDIPGVVSGTTAAIAFDDDAAAIEAAINAVIGADQASVTGGDIATADIVVTFDGTLVAGKAVPAMVLDNSLTDAAVPVADPAVTVDAAGGSAFACVAILSALGVVAEDEPSAAGVDYTPGPNLANVKPWFVQAMAREQAAQSGDSQIEQDILAVLS